MWYDESAYIVPYVHRFVVTAVHLLYAVGSIMSVHSDALFLFASVHISSQQGARSMEWSRSAELNISGLTGVTAA